jgi:hypothetical protein
LTSIRKQDNLGVKNKRAGEEALGKDEKGEMKKELEAT